MIQRPAYATNKDRRGFTLLELALVMGVIGVVIGAIWYAVGNTREAQKENDAVFELQSTATNILTLMQGRSYPGQATITTDMINAKVIPSNFVDADGVDADNPWAGAGGFMVYGNPDNKANEIRRVRLSFYNVPYSGCLALLLQGTTCQAGQSGCPADVFANYTAGSPVASPDANAGWAIGMTPNIAATMCAFNNAHQTTNSVEFDFSL
jgi:prepilin-type N-terminal cleavage/methylation domain-containing protein